MEQIMNYVKPELLVLAVVLYFVGTAMKKTEMIADKYIPVTLGALGILLCSIWVIATCRWAVCRRLLWQYLRQLSRVSW